MSDQHWSTQALCREVDPDIFMPEKGGSTANAKKVCANCPVTAECLLEALELDERFGIRGGLSEQERRRLKKPKPIPAQRQPSEPRTPQRPCWRKARYNSEASAVAAQSRMDPGWDATSAYVPTHVAIAPCADCDGWHLTNRRAA